MNDEFQAARAVLIHHSAFIVQRLPRRLRRLLRLRARVPLEGARRGELAELVADHVLRHVDGDVALAVVDGEGQADEVGRDGRAARPSLDRGRAGSALPNLLDLLLQVPVNERPFFYRTCHFSLLDSLAKGFGFWVLGFGFNLTPNT